MTPFVFQKAQPIWAKGRENEKNCELAFLFPFNGSAPTTVAISASSIYRLWVNGVFVAAGPARTAHGYFRVDELNLTAFLKPEHNVVAVEVVCFNINSYDTLDQPAFLTAEFARSGQVIAYTGGGMVQIFDRGQRIQKVQRYSYQRAFAEAYRLREKDEAFYLTGECSGMQMEASVQPSGIYIKREVRYPLYEIVQPSSVNAIGTVDFSYRCESPIRDRCYVDIGEALHGFRPEELEVYLSDDAQNMQFYLNHQQSRNMPVELKDGFALLEFPYNATGFLRFTLNCATDCTATVLFDEILKDGQLDFLRLTSCNCFRYQLDKGTHHIMTFAPYTMKYVKVIIQGAATLAELDLVEYKHPPTHYQVNLPDNDNLQIIYRAALETYLANAVDVFSDCPSRERAGWLCDSYFIARVEHVLTGESVLEKAYLENFLLPKNFRNIPEGMLPMCYPSDHYNKEFIPNWAMWFVLELEEYVKRSGDRNLVEQAKPRVYALLKYFRRFENDLGLLEKLENWIFVEWSRANDPDVVQDINYPTNMLYSRMLLAVSRLYNDLDLAHKSAELCEVIRSRSLKGIFFTDNERRTAEGLENPCNCTEACQYYAFFTGVASVETDPELWWTLVRDFGPKRKQTGLHKYVAFANAFIGNYLRLELLYQAGRYEDVINDIQGYFTEMAQRTGTLWEHDSPSASCNHGFASHVIYWMAGIFGISPRKELQQ